MTGSRELKRGGGGERQRVKERETETITERNTVFADGR